MESLAAKLKLLKELMQHMKHSHKVFLQREQGINKILEEADNFFFKNNIHFFRFYFITSVVIILKSIMLLIFIVDYVRLKALVTGLTISRIPQIEARMQTKSECDIHWYIFLAIVLLLCEIALWLIWEKLKTLKPWQRKFFANTVHTYVFLADGNYHVLIKLMSTKANLEIYS